jgi:DNA-binding MarR family transcriptional regulator
MNECTLAQFDVLAHLMREKKGIPHAELSRNLLVTAGNVTGLIDRMESSGLVRRRNDSNDRRVTLVELTAKGRKLAESVIPRHSADIESLFDALSEREKTQLRAILDKLITRLE